MENETELFHEENKDGSTIMTSKRLTNEQRQIDLARKFFEQMRRGETGIIYNTETGKLEEVK